MTRPDGPVPIRRTLERLMSGMGAPEIDATTTIIDAWPDIVGPELASRIVAVAVRGPELVVRVEDPAWASQLGWLEQQLLARIEALVGPGRITSVIARVAPRDAT
ncbi:MAG: DUF721 domain-containing protein [Acidimicrobiales bacterium]|nr:hypothetical protein [Acidimicrobiaceae bacterium]MCP4222941.1 DUF721 domain-containing protein [Actinomycetes bacterium]MCP4744093.1 DUF721 domain-containing protein [Actinomycetales bacterium]MDP6105087.1 DUF721 domain-containing protein [Acidimicrobiales bacterium]MCP4844436.1 DUF721 domain-containing protein [Actinomycetes bacterium]